MFKGQFGRKRTAQAAAPARKVSTQAPSTAEARTIGPSKVEAKGIPASPPSKAVQGNPTHEQIALRAYQLWLTRGQPMGTDREDWFEAERLLAESSCR